MRAFEQIKTDIKKGKSVVFNDGMSLSPARFRIVLAEIKAKKYRWNPLEMIWEKTPVRKF